MSSMSTSSSSSLTSLVAGRYVLLFQSALHSSPLLCHGRLPPSPPIPTSFWHYGRSIGAFKNTRRHIIIKQEGDKNEEELKKGHGIIYFMANIKQDELWVDLLFNGDGNTTKRIMEGLSYLHKNMNIVIVENRFMQQSVKSRSVLGNAISTVGKKSILAFWRQIHLKIQCQPHGTWQFSEIQYKSDRGRE